MTRFLQQIIDGISSGCLYATMALALVLIYRATHFVNLAQGEMALFSTYVAWQLSAWGLPILLALLVTVVLSFSAGMVIERSVIRPFASSNHLTVVIVALGLFLAFNGTAGLIWTGNSRIVPTIVPDHVLRVGGLAVTWPSVSLVAVLVAEIAVLWVFFQKTRLGLAMRAAADNAESSSLVGIRVGRTLMIGWGLAAGLGAVAGVLVAPKLFLNQNMMFTLLVYSIAAATLGGLDSPLGAVIGGLVVGISENLAGTYVSWIGADLKIGVPLFIIFIVLLVRPNGLFGKAPVVRV